MNVRRIVLDEDYPLLKTWWERRGAEAPQRALLPPIGVLVEQFCVPMACAFLYEVKDAPIAMVEWEATNPDCRSAMATVRALNMVFDFLETYCADNGIAVVLSWVEEGRGDGRILSGRKWRKCPGERHALMAFQTQPQEAPCLPS